MGKTAVVTGGSIGIGFETARLLIEEGWNVVICSRTEKDVRKAEKELGEKCFGVVCDITKSSDLDKLVEKVKEKYGEVDVLVNNAGLIYWKPLKKQSDEEIEFQVRTNLEGLIKLTNRFLPLTKGKIVNISSGAGKTGYAELTTYCATKFGVRGFTQALAQELEIPVYCVNPGMTKTRMTNFQGIPAVKVAEVVLNTINGNYDLSSGDDVDVWDKV